jgi:hypothetical protein
MEESPPMSMQNILIYKVHFNIKTKNSRAMQRREPMLPMLTYGTIQDEDVGSSYVWVDIPSDLGIDGCSRGETVIAGLALAVVLARDSLQA